VRKADVVPGHLFAVRNRGGAHGTDPFVKGRHLGGVHNNQVKVRFESGELDGLEEWVRTRDLVCRWEDVAIVLRDEERIEDLRRADEQVWDRVYEEAIDVVMEASGEYTGFLRRWVTDPASAERFWSRGELPGSPLEDDVLNFVDRHGQWHLSLATAVRACEGFAAAEPELVLLFLRDWEERLTAEGWEPGRRAAHEVLRQWAPAHALARSWTPAERRRSRGTGNPTATSSGIRSSSNAATAQPR
jgi:hypothetical protein